MATKNNTQKVVHEAAPSVIGEVLQEISKERQEAHEALRVAEKLLTDTVDAINETGMPLVLVMQEAQADVKAHERFMGRLPKQAYDAKARQLQAILEDAQAKHRVLQKDAQERIQPMQAAVQARATKCQELAREWLSHLRFAKASGVDVAAYWTPEGAAAQ